MPRITSYLILLLFYLLEFNLVNFNTNQNSFNIFTLSLHHQHIHLIQFNQTFGFDYDKFAEIFSSLLRQTCNFILNLLTITVRKRLNDFVKFLN